MEKIRTNLKKINPLKENELFSNHNYKKMTLSNFTSNSYFNTIYKPFNTQKYSLSSIEKNKKFGVTLNVINQKNKTNYNLKQNFLSQIPYPSFPNNNKIPSIYKNSHKMTKYPKILKSNFTIYNFNSQKNSILKNNFYNNNNSNSLVNNTNNLIKQDKNRTYGGDLKFFKFNDLFNKKIKLKNINKKDKSTSTFENIQKKKVKISSNIKINNFSNALNNIIHLIEMRDEHNNKIIYTKVTNLLLDEINKFLELQRKRDELNKYKNKGTSKYKKIKINKKRPFLNESENESFIKRKKGTRRSLNANSIDLKFHRKYGFDIKINDTSLSKDGKSDLSLLSKDSSFDNIYKDFYSKNRNYKNENVQTVNKISRDTNNNSFKEIIKNNESKKNIININENSDINNIKKNDNNNNNLFNLDNKQNGNSIFNTFIKDSKKKREKKSEKKDEKKKNIKKNEENFNFSNLLNNIVSKIEPSLIKNKDENNSRKNNYHKKDIPIFEQMVKNDKLINLIHEYMKNENENEEREEYEENDIEEKNKNKNKNENQDKEEINKNNQNIDQNEVKIKIINEYYRNNLVKNKKIERRKKRSRTYIIPKIELGMEIIKHICAEININKNEKDNIINCMFNLMKISRKENKTKKEDNLQKKMLKPINEIIQKYLENMQNINLSNEIPSSLFSSSVKSFLKEKLREILDIGYEDNNEEEEKRKKAVKKKIKELERNKKEKRFVYDKNYFFRNTPKHKRRESIITSGLTINSNKTDDDDVENNKFYGTSSSFDLLDKRNKKKSIKINKRRETKFTKHKKTMAGLKKLSDEEEVKIENNNIENVEDENKLKNEEILDKRLKAFFEQIKELKNIKNSRDEEKLRLFIDKEIDKFDYTQEKKIEARKYNFFNDLKVARIALKNGKSYINNKLLFHSPIIFNTYKNNE